MAICPNCKRETGLFYEEESIRTMEYFCKADKTGMDFSIKKEKNRRNGNGTYFCAHCGTPLFNEHEQARAFLCNEVI